MTYTKDNLRQIFQQPFNQERWQTMLLHYFHATELRAERERIEDRDDEEQGYYLGAIDTTDSYRIVFSDSFIPLSSLPSLCLRKDYPIFFLDDANLDSTSVPSPFQVRCKSVPRNGRKMGLT